MSGLSPLSKAPNIRAVAAMKSESSSPPRPSFRVRVLLLLALSAAMLLVSVAAIPKLDTVCTALDHARWWSLPCPALLQSRPDCLADNLFCGSGLQSNGLQRSAYELVIGVGKADITGPVVEVDFMGYANGSQLGSGLRQRLFARSFIVSDPADPANTWVYCVLDTQSGDTAIRSGILEGLRAIGGEFARYTPQNVAIVGTHSHSGPGAWLNYFLPQVTTRGFSRASYEAIVNGTLLSIQRAHSSQVRGFVSLGNTTIEGANINRSPWAYEQNPAAERDALGSDVEKTMTMLRFTRASDDTDIGILTWFPVHGTSMLGNNTHVTGDNKGVAADLFEKSQGHGFVAGFSQANVGDTSPNVNGAYCESGPDAGLPCSYEQSLCGNRSQACHGRGPHFGLDDAGTKSCFEIGRRQYQGALNLFRRKAAFTALGGSIRSLHTFHDMSNYTFSLSNGSIVSTCSAALGYSFAAGTTDGPGAFDFKQNDTDTPDANPLWAIARKAIHEPSPEQIQCQQPKPILFDAGATIFPYQWAPNIVDIQLLRIGDLFIVVSPGEATTMAGIRWKAAIAARVKDLGISRQPRVVIGAPANSYTHYITTREEYSVQRYEGASTLYGQWTLDAYISKSAEILHHLADQRPPALLDAGPTPPDNRDKSLNFITPVIYDFPGVFRSFGDVLIAPNGSYQAGETAKVVFAGANPRNNFRLEDTFAAVQTQDASAEWFNYKDDTDWELLFEWKRTSTVLGTSQVSLSWDIPATVPPGKYRFLYQGDSKGVGGIKSFHGTSEVFVVAL